MSTLPNYKLIDLEYNPKSIFDILYKNMDLVVATTRVHIVNEPDVQEIRDLLNLQNIHHILHFSVPPGKFSSIHIDAAGKEDIYDSFAINLPLHNSDKVKMSWFKPLVEEELIINTTVYPPVPVLNQHEAEYIESVYYTQPTSVQILKWHNVINESDDYAYFCSLRFFK